MKKLLCLLAAVLLMTGCVSTAFAATEFAPANTLDAQEKALRLMKKVAFASEYGNTHNLVRWDRPIRIHIGGTVTKQDRAFLEDFLIQLASRVPMLPNLTIVKDAQEATLKIWYGPLKELKNHIEGYESGNWGYFRYWYTSSRITRAQVVIASDVTTQKERNHLIMEEIVGLLGLTNDHDVYSDSIVYQPWTTTQALSEVDWMMLNMVYHPDVKHGMPWAEFEKVTRQRINNR